MIKFLYFNLIILFPLTHTLCAQNQQKIDSIYTELKKDISQKDQFSAYRHLFQLYYKNNKIELAKTAMDSLVLIPTEDSLEIGIRAYTKALYYSRVSKIDEAIIFNKEALVYLRGPESNSDRAKALSNMGLIQRRKGDYEKAIAYTLQSLRFKDSVGINKNKLGFDYHLVASIYGELNNFEESNKYFELAKDVYKESDQPNFVKYMEMNLGTNYSSMGQYDKAMGLLLSCEDYFKEINDINALAQVNSDLGQLHLDQGGNMEKAEYYFRKVIDMDGKVYNQEMMASNYGKLGAVLYNKKAYHEALPIIIKSVEMNKTSGAYNALAGNYGKLAKVYASLNDYQKAYNYNNLQFHIEDSLTGQKNLETVNTLKIAYETEMKEAEIVQQGQEIELLEKRNKVQKLTQTVYGIGMFSLLAIGFLLYFGFKQRIKKNRIENEKKEELYKTELSFKKKELTSQTLHLVKKNTFIQELKKNLEKIHKTPDLFKTEFRRIMVLLKKEAAEDKDWEVFKSYFSQVHGDFDHKIKAISTDVTDKEMRLASFLRMNLSTKEIASMFNVLPDSVLTSKYRLKKKLNIPKEGDLGIFLNEL